MAESANVSETIERLTNIHGVTSVLWPEWMLPKMTFASRRGEARD